MDGKKIILIDFYIEKFSFIDFYIEKLVFWFLYRKISLIDFYIELYTGLLLICWEIMLSVHEQECKNLLHSIIISQGKLLLLFIVYFPFLLISNCI